MDEISPFGETQVIEIRSGETTRVDDRPEALRLRRRHAGRLAGGTPEDNAATVMRVLRGDGNAAATAAVVLNAAAAFYVSGKVDDFGEGVDAAKSAISSGAGLVALERLRTAFASR